MDKQKRELAWLIFQEADCSLSGQDCDIIADLLINKGYRKSSEGEWEFRNDGAYGRTRCYCTACGKHSGIGGIRENQLKPFCPNCGADMRGETNDNRAEN